MRQSPSELQSLSPLLGSASPQLAAAVAEASPGEAARVRHLRRRASNRPQLFPAPARRLIVLCLEPAESQLWDRIRRETTALAGQGGELHFFCPHPVELDSRIQLHVLGVSESGLVEQSSTFARQVIAALPAEMRGDGSPVLAYEWGAIPAMLALGADNRRVISLESLERQRSDDLQRPLSHAIDAIERAGLATAQHIILRDDQAAAQAAEAEPTCRERLLRSRWVFPAHEFATSIDPGEVKSRYHVGPIDPTILFVGDLDWRHGAELLIKTMPPVLKNHPQARLIVVGDGEMLWPLRVQSHYMLLDHAVRIVGDLQGQAARELVAAADLVAVPSREQTEDWQIFAAWAAGRPVIATHETAGHLCVHEQDCLLIYPNPGSCVWGVERLLYDPDLGRRLIRGGAEHLDQLHGWAAVGAELAGLLFPLQQSSEERTTNVV